jgi:hypothetical protein
MLNGMVGPARRRRIIASLLVRSARFCFAFFAYD